LEYQQRVMIFDSDYSMMLAWWKMKWKKNKGTQEELNKLDLVRLFFFLWNISEKIRAIEGF
jgi:hypothetical protein